jgi:AcrR family transcriptional regulator
MESPSEHTRSREDRRLEEVRFLVVSRLRARREEIEEAIFVHVRDEIPGPDDLLDPGGPPDPVGRQDEEYLQGLRTAVRAALDYMLAGIEQARAPTKLIPAEAVAQARRAARNGVSVDTVLRRYVAGHALLSDFVMQELAHEDLDAQRIALRRVLGTSASLLDRLIGPITAAYREETERAAGPRLITIPTAGYGAIPKAGAIPGQGATPAQGGAVPGSGEVPAPRAIPRSPVARMQRARILDAIVAVVAERGFAGASVNLVLARAKVSRRTFYEHFESLQDGFLATLDLALERPAQLIEQAFMRERSWQDGALYALASLLAFFDSEPELTQIWFIEAMATGQWALQRHERVAAQLRTTIVEFSSRQGLPPLEPRAAAGVMGSVLSLIQTHLIAGEPEPLIELLGPLMGLVTAPYLDGEGVARATAQGAQLAREIQAGEERWAHLLPTAQPELEQDQALLSTLTNPSAPRARECLLFLAEQGERGIFPSNREIAAGIGVAHQSQISKLLSYLTRQDLIRKHSSGAGKRNAWRLTTHGVEIARALSDDRDDGDRPDDDRFSRD